MTQLYLAENYERESRAFRFLVCLVWCGHAKTIYLARKRKDAKTKGRENEKKRENHLDNLTGYVTNKGVETRKRYCFLAPHFRFLVPHFRFLVHHFRFLVHQFQFRFLVHTGVPWYVVIHWDIMVCGYTLGYYGIWLYTGVS